MDSYGRLSNVFPIRGPKRQKNLVRPAGQAWVDAGTAVAGTATDDLGYTVSVDSSGNPIHGTVTDHGTSVPDDYLDLPGGLLHSGGGGGGGGAGGGLSAADRTALINGASSILGQSITAISSALTAGNDAARAQLASDTALRLQDLRNQAAEAQRTGDAATAQRAQAAANQLQMFQSQMGLQQSNTWITIAAIGAGVALLGIAAWFFTKKPSSSGSRKSVRSNPSKARRHRRSRRHRR